MNELSSPTCRSLLWWALGSESPTLVPAQVILRLVLLQTYPIGSSRTARPTPSPMPDPTQAGQTGNQKLDISNYRIMIESTLNLTRDSFRIEASPMSKTFNRGDHVEWNSEAGRVRGVIVKKIVSDVRVKGYVHHASKKKPQYFIKSDKTDHVAIHKGKALRLVKTQTRNRPRKIG